MCDWRMGRCRNGRQDVSSINGGAGTLSPRDAIVSASAAADGVTEAIQSETFIPPWSDTIWRWLCGHVCMNTDYKSSLRCKG